MLRPWLANRDKGRRLAQSVDMCQIPTEFTLNTRNGGGGGRRTGGDDPHSLWKSPTRVLGSVGNPDEYGRRGAEDGHAFAHDQ